MEKFFCCCPCIPFCRKKSEDRSERLLKPRESQADDDYGHVEEALKRTALGLVGQIESEAQQKLNREKEDIEPKVDQIGAETEMIGRNIEKEGAEVIKVIDSGVAELEQVLDTVKDVAATPTTDKTTANDGQAPALDKETAEGEKAGGNVAPSASGISGNNSESTDPQKATNEGNEKSKVRKFRKRK